MRKQITFTIAQIILSGKNSLQIRNGFELNKILKADKEYPDYREMPTAQSAQQSLKLLDKNWESFFKAIKVWMKDKSKFLGKPKFPNYRKKGGKSIPMPLS